MLLPPLKPVPFPSCPLPLSPRVYVSLLSIITVKTKLFRRKYSSRLHGLSSLLHSLQECMLQTTLIVTDLSPFTPGKTLIYREIQRRGKVGRLMRSRLAATFYLNLSRLPYPCASHLFSFLPINIFFITSAQHSYTFCLYLFTAIGVLC